jgi:acyl-CoA synthetase (AMP-forming)/AMP-acid ligase II
VPSSGRPHPGADIEVRDEDGNLVDTGCVGDLWIRGRAVGGGYVSSASRDAFTDKGLRTGDIGFILDDDLFVLGRIADRIKVRGKNVYAEDMEARVERAAGLRVGTVLVLPPMLSRADQGVTVLWEARCDAEQQSTVAPIIKYAVSRVAGHDAKVQVVVVPSNTIPRTTSGKPQRRRALANLRAGTYAGAHGLEL